MSKRRATLIFAALTAGGILLADLPPGYKKAYFTTTKPGAFAKYRMTAPGAPDGFTTYTRLPDEHGQQRLQVRFEVTAEGKTTISYSSYTLEEGFSLEQDALGFGKAIESASVWHEGEDPEDLDDDDLEDLRAATPDFGPTATLFKTETVEGKRCDRYKYTQRHSGEREGLETGSIWLNESVPFGLVRQSGAARDASGKVLFRFGMTLVDSGVRAPAAARAAAPRAQRSAAGPPVRLADAYEEGQVELSVEVAPGSAGSGLRVVFKNTSDEAIRLAIPSGATTLTAAPPVETLRLESASTWVFDLEPGESSDPVELSQTGSRRVARGKFVISLSRGKPVFSGDAKMESEK